MDGRRRSLRLAGVMTTLLIALLGSPVVAQEAETADGKVGAKLDPGTDRLIAKRLLATYANLESLEGVDVTVNAGVVKLVGAVVSSDARALAGALARQIEGVTAVENEIAESRSLRRRMAAVWAELEERAWDAAHVVPLLVVALLVIAGFALLARLLGRSERLYAWITSNVFLRDLARQVVQGTVVILGILLALEILDATALVGAVLGAAGLAGLAIGFAFRDLVENYIASILLSLRQPFAPNDHVIIEGHEGKVVRLTSRATILLTFDGNHVRLPNATVFKAPIVNFSRKPERRFQFVVGVGVEENLASAQDLAVEVLRKIEGVLEEPAPFSLVETLGDSNVALRVFAWVDQQKSDFGRVRSEAIRLVKNAFDAQGIEMPEPIVRVRVESGAEVAEAAPAVAETTVARDVAPDDHMDREIQAERAAEEPDLLSADAPPE
jgi:small-conductance mechanosensitive channel